MRTFLLTWNPGRWSWDTFREDILRLESTGTLSERWSCGVRQELPPGSEIYLLRPGSLPDEKKGIIGRGIAGSSPYRDAHWSEDRPHDTALYIDVDFDSLAEDPVLPLPRLIELSPNFSWTPQSSGIEIPQDLAAQIRKEWTTVVSALSYFPEEVGASGTFIEGASRTVQVNAYERSHAARVACIEHYGPRCLACNIDMSDVYGPIAAGYIHIHHVVPLSQIREGYIVDYIHDLIPLCPNCHAIAHLRTPPLSLKGLKAKIKEARN